MIKKIFAYKIYAFCAIVFCGIQNISIGQTTTVSFTNTGSTTWTVPPCVYQITVEAWGGGGGGGAVWSKFLNGCSATACNQAELCTAGGGGGGGGFASRTYSVLPGQVYTITVGAGGAGGFLNATGTNRANNGSQGESSYFSGPATAGIGALTANGGNGGGRANYYETSSTSSMSGHLGANGAGGSGGAGSNGSVNFTGGAGANGAHSSNSPDRSGGGGGGAGSSQNGFSANVNTAGAGGSSGGGNGGDGGYINNYVGAQYSGGNNGLIIGGGGSGALIHNRVTQNNTSITTTDRQRAGGNGQRGEVRITYSTSPDPSLGSGFLNGEWAFHGAVNTDWEDGSNWRVWNGAQFVIPASNSHPTTTSDVRLKSGTCLAQPTVNSINGTSTNNTNLSGAATCRNLTIESTGVLTINPNANVEHFHILGDYYNSGTVNYNNGRFKFVKNGFQTIRDASQMATFYEMNIGGTSTTQLINSTGVTILNALRVNGVVVTNGNLFWLNTTAVDFTNPDPNLGTGVVTYGGHIFGTFRRTIQNNNATYRFPVGVGATLNTDRRLLEYINNGIVGVSHLDCFATNTFFDAVNNQNSALDPSKATEWGQFLNVVHPEAQWTLTPSAAFTTGNYGLRLYVQNFASIGNPLFLTSPLDNRFAILKRPTGSSTFFDFDAYDNSTTIPNGGLPGRVWNSGNGYAEKLGFTQFSEFVIASAPLPLSVELKSIQLECASQGNRLSWSTATEHDNDFYKVERSDSDGNFALVGVVEATGNSSVESNYEFIDLNPIRGVSYYRLSQTDYNGEQTILGVLSSEWPCQEGSDELMLYPNPSEGDVQVVFSHEGRDEYSVETFNAVGQVVLTPINGVAQYSGSTLIKLDTEELPVGVYMVRVKVGEKVFTEKLVRE